MMTQASMTAYSIVSVDVVRLKLDQLFEKKLSKLAGEEAQLFIEAQLKWRDYVEVELRIIDLKFEDGTARVCARNMTEELLICDRIYRLS